MKSEKEDTVGSLEEERRRLYSSRKEIERPEAHLSRSPAPSTPHKWDNDGKAKTKKIPHKHVRFALGFFWSAIGFFVIALGIATYLFLSGGRSVSVNHVSVAIKGPTTIAGGDTVALSISVTNNNPTAIQDTTLSLVFPTGTRRATDVTQSVTHDDEAFGVIAPGASVERTVRVVLFGGQGDTIKIPATLQFKTHGSNAVFVKHTSYALSVISTPLSVSVEAPTETVSGQVFSITANVRSNATKPISNVGLNIGYPTGFTPTKTSLTPTGTLFSLGTLSPGQTVTVRVSGKLTGQDGELRVFRFSVGTANGANTSIALSYMTQTAEVNIMQPFLATTLSINGKTSGPTIVSAGETAHISLSWKNTLSVPIDNALIEVKLSGAPFNQNIQVVGGQYQSATQTIVFSRDSDPSFASLAPGAQGVGSFTITPQSTSTEAIGTNQTITMTVSVSGQRLGQDNVAQAISSTVSKKIKISTALSLNSYALYSTGGVVNSGPVPPVANQMTTYTIMWNVHNTTNDVAGATITANLPTYVQFVGAVAPRDNSLSYDNGAHTVTWNIGNLSAGESRTGSFQVSFIPSTSQHGSEPVLVNKPVFSGFDRFAQVHITANTNVITTNMSHDPKYSSVSGSGMVQ
ncbi:MAG TPA: hypothetical protein ENJ75_02780 [Candidatus Kaiserbacteria bacterium]|nr:hypothetical protein [Candidatus Kaiserbacteria bacterium]